MIVYTEYKIQDSTFLHSLGDIKKHVDGHSKKLTELVQVHNILVQIPAPGIN